MLVARGPLAIAIALVVGCSREPAKQAGPNPDVVAGQLTVDGRPVTLSACRVGHLLHVYVELITSGGVLRFDPPERVEDQHLYWQPDPAVVSAGALIACEKLDRKWGGGVRADGTAYWRGFLDVRCPGPPRIEGKVTIDCGHITAQERQELDKNEADHKQQKP